MDNFGIYLSSLINRAIYWRLLLLGFIFFNKFSFYLDKVKLIKILNKLKLLAQMIYQIKSYLLIIFKKDLAIA